MKYRVVLALAFFLSAIFLFIAPKEFSFATFSIALLCSFQAVVYCFEEYESDEDDDDLEDEK